MPRTAVRSTALVGVLTLLVLASCNRPSTTSAPPTASPAASPPAEAPAPRAPSWEAIATEGAPPARREHSFTANASGQKAYLFGGRSGGTPRADLWELDVASASWRQIEAEGPSPRFGHNAAFISGMLVIFGGQAGPSTFFNDVWRFDPGTSAWTQAAPSEAVPQPRYGAGGTVIAGSFVISHGFTNQGRFDDTWSLDGTWSEVSPDSGQRPMRRCLLRTAFVGGSQLLLFGGQSNASPFLGDTWIYDLEERRWEEVTGTSPEPRNLYVLGSVGARAVLFGGRTASGPVNDLWVFQNGSWSKLAAEGTQPPARSGADGAVLPEGILVFGGDSASGELNDLWRLQFPSE